MAQTKASSSRSQSRSKNASTRRSGGSSSRSANGRKGQSRSSKTTKSQSQSRRPQASANGRRSDNGKQSTVATIAQKAKAPAIAGGAALAGLAGGIALHRRNNRKSGVLSKVKAPNVKLPKPNDAVKAVGRAAGTVAERSHQVGDVATQVQRASEAIKNGKR